MMFRVGFKNKWLLVQELEKYMKFMWNMENVMQYKGLLELCYKGRYFDMKVLSAERDVRFVFLC